MSGEAVTRAFGRAAVVLLLLVGLAVVGILVESAPPYVVSVIDYHFHDAHPTPPLSNDRTLIFRSQALNAHNVTIPAAGFSENVRPGNEIVVERIGELLGGPGEYRFYCKFHVDRGMTGTIVIEG